MKIDVVKFSQNNQVLLDERMEVIPKNFEGTEIRGMKDTRVFGSIKIGYEDEVYVQLHVTGTFLLPCAITLEDVEYPFSTEIEEDIGKFDDFYDKVTNSLDIFPIIWENIISEVPIRVVKVGVDASQLNGEFWEVKSE